MRFIQLPPVLLWHLDHISRHSLQKIRLKMCEEKAVRKMCEPVCVIRHIVVVDHHKPNRGLVLLVPCIQGKLMEDQGDCGGRAPATLGGPPLGGRVVHLFTGVQRRFHPGCQK